MQTQAPETMSLKEAGRVLGYSERTVRELIRAGEVEAVYRSNKPTRVTRRSVFDANRRWGGDGLEVTVGQASDTLNRAPYTIYEYAKAGRLTPIRRGPNCFIRFKLWDVLRLNRELNQA